MLLLEGKANLENTGAITMLSADTMAQAPAAIVERFQSIREVNLSGMSNLGGECVAPEQHQHAHVDTRTSHPPLTSQHLLHATGDIQALAGLVNLTKLSLLGCKKLQGED